MADSVTGVPVFTVVDLQTTTKGANQLGGINDAGTLTITTPGTNASLVSQTALATTVVHSGSGTGGTILVTVGAAGEVTKVDLANVTGLQVADTITISAIDSDVMDTNCVLTVAELPVVVRDRWNSTATVIVSDAPGDLGDGNERVHYVSKTLGAPWLRQNAKPGTNDSSFIIVPV